jgi:hypothetical protein
MPDTPNEATQKQPAAQESVPKEPSAAALALSLSRPVAMRLPAEPSGGSFATHACMVGLYEQGADHVLWNGALLPLVACNAQQNMPLGPVMQITFHYPGSNHTTLFDDFHFNVPYFARHNRASVVRTLRSDQLGRHLYHRNYGNLAIGLSGGYDACAVTNYKGPFGLKDDQIDVAARLGAELCLVHGIDPTAVIQAPEYGWDKRNRVITLTGRKIWVPTVTDHSFYGLKDGTHAADLLASGPTLVRDLKEYYRDLKAMPDAKRAEQIRYASLYTH